FPLTSGDAANVLNVPFDVVLSASCARKYFGDENPVGKTLLINGTDRANVRGVMKDIPANSHLRVDMLFSMSTLLKGMNPSLENNWRSLRCNTYLLLRPDTPPDPLNAKINQLLKSKIDQPDVQYLTTLEPLRSIYLHGKPRGSRSGNAVTGNSTNLYVCSLAAALALFIACLNFVNLSTAFSLRRTKEIGVRKILGAARSGLVLQFLTDAIALSLMAFVISVGLISIITPVFNQIAGKMISSGLLEHPSYVVLLLMASLITGAISGLYPAVFVSSFKAADSVKGRFTSGARGVALRKILVTSQFLISFVLIVATAVLYKQLDFMQNEQLGFKKDHMLAVDFQFDPRAGSQVTKNQLMTIPGVSGASVSSSLPGRPNHKRETTIQRFDGSKEPSGFDAYFVDFDFIDQYNLKIIAGRKFSPSIASDSTQAMIINEAAVKALGYYNPDDVLGKPYSQSGRTGTIIGVVKDFHFQSFREEIQPLTMQAGGIATFMTLSIADTDIPSTISKLEKKWKSIVPDMPFSYFFTDEAYNSQYDSDRRFSQLFLCLVTVAIIISCLGLFGLTVFSTTQRTKEIGIRKVLGSSSIQIVSLITKDFFTLIATAFFLGIPVSWFLMDRWLQEFAYRTDVSIWIYGLAGVALGLIAFVTISFQAIQAANADPVRSLKAE
ncbi:MAG TPA: FtsX-like permease family protein, partial [Chryseosolibacter sp.]|nr:FtsX-like permease family protein [Chryseosolibacter sp.]